MAKRQSPGGRPGTGKGPTARKRNPERKLKDLAPKKGRNVRGGEISLNYSKIKYEYQP